MGRPASPEELHKIAHDSWTVIRERAAGRRFWLRNDICPPVVAVPIGISIDYKTRSPLITYWLWDDGRGEASVALTRDFADFLAYYHPVGDLTSPFPLSQPTRNHRCPNCNGETLQPQNPSSGSDTKASKPNDSSQT